MRLILIFFILTLFGCVNQTAFLFQKQEWEEGDPRLIEMKAPIYPYSMLENEIEGFVILNFSINEKGWVEDIEVIEEYPDNIFRDSAIKSLKSRKYKPKVVEGLPIKAINQLSRITFLINGKSASDIEIKQRNCENSKPEWTEALNCTKLSKGSL